ncbi:MAG: hypothetical protein ACR2OR_03365 [Hyphomicrobiales bacterium]
MAEKPHSASLQLDNASQLLRGMETHTKVITTLAEAMIRTAQAIDDPGISEPLDETACLIERAIKAIEINRAHALRAIHTEEADIDPVS